ncbi:inositol 1,4,5-triphosphate receptor associated 2 isoform X2 [Xyrauchen texanus]|uniref:inositol 1,4,5-triphosphate receptor associated 2 isoform X2 n=2 Tax=Xyrauchen texanus TaxID=154827 RepID=UPI002241DE06|nr:inositol 1,4,5-triphosphate receptor associated 2 isoform X2 [Xyrauchen texanus]
MVGKGHSALVTSMERCTTIQCLCAGLMTESRLSGHTGILDDSECDEDPNSEKPVAESWEERSIMDRLGLKSLDMTEEEVESAFSQFAMGFHCDQYTLSQRLQAELHDRIVAEENLQRELQHTRETLQVLYEGLAEVDSREMVLQMQNRLQVVESNMENIITTAEMLGAVHQEARVSHAVDVMSVHIEHLKRRHTSESEELLEVRKLLHRRKGRLHSDSTDDRDVFFRQSQQCMRRRVSVTLLPTQAQSVELEAASVDGCKTRADADSPTQKGLKTRQETVPSDCPESSLTFDLPDRCTQKQKNDADDTAFPCAIPVTPLRCRRQSPPIKPTERSEEAESARGAGSSLKSNPQLCVARHRRHFLSWRRECGWRILSLMFCVIIIAALTCLTLPIM